MLAATGTALVRFVGIVLMTSQFSNAPQALIPRIPNSHSDVEAHTAFIAFEACNYVSSKGWTVSGFTPVDGMLYVALDGDRITFAPASTTSSPSTASTASTARQAPVDGPGTSISQQPPAALPHIRSCCGAPATLLTDFAPPPYPQMPKSNQLAAVVDFPKGYSEAACNGTDKGRIDTLVTIPAGDFVDIQAVHGSVRKSIRVKKGATIYVANLPTWYVNGGSETNGPMHETHYEVYYKMMEHGKCGSWPACAQAASANCNGSFIRSGASPTVVPQSPWQNWAARVDIDCSNSQYP